MGNRDVCFLNIKPDLQRINMQMDDQAIVWVSQDHSLLLAVVIKCKYSVRNFKILLVHPETELEK